MYSAVPCIRTFINRVSNRLFILCTGIICMYLVKKKNSKNYNKIKNHVFAYIHTYYYWSEVPEALTVYIILTGEVPRSQHRRQNGALPT